jgi:hypothetical protein
MDDRSRSDGDPPVVLLGFVRDFSHRLGYCGCFHPVMTKTTLNQRN